jgi:hypothetical protein
MASNTSSNQEAAATTSGTVIPTWSIPSRPGTDVTCGRSPFSFGDHSGFFAVCSYAMPCG